MSRPGFCKGGGKPEILAARGGGTREPPPPLNTYACYLDDLDYISCIQYLYSVRTTIWTSCVADRY